MLVHKKNKGDSIMSENIDLIDDEEHLKFNQKERDNIIKILNKIYDYNE